MNGNYNSLCSIHISTHNLTFMKTWSLFWMCHSQHQAYTWFTEWSSMGGNCFALQENFKILLRLKRNSEVGWSWTRPILNILQMQKCHIDKDNWLENRHSFKVLASKKLLGSIRIFELFLFNFAVCTAEAVAWSCSVLWQWHIIKNCNLVVL